VSLKEFGALEASGRRSRTVPLDDRRAPANPITAPGLGDVHVASIA